MDNDEKIRADKQHADLEEATIAAAYRKLENIRALYYYTRAEYLKAVKTGQLSKEKLSALLEYKVYLEKVKCDHEREYETLSEKLDQFKPSED